MAAHLSGAYFADLIPLHPDPVSFLLSSPDPTDTPPSSFPAFPLRGTSPFGLDHSLGLDRAATRLMRRQLRTRRADNRNLRGPGSRDHLISSWVIMRVRITSVGSRGSEPDKTASGITNEPGPLLRSRRTVSFSRYEQPTVGERSRPLRDCGPRRLYPACDSFWFTARGHTSRYISHSLRTEGSK